MLFQRASVLREIVTVDADVHQKIYGYARFKMQIVSVSAGLHAEVAMLLLMKTMNIVFRMSP